MWKWMRRMGVVVILITCSVSVYIIWLLRYQGATTVDWRKIEFGTVSFDAQGIPTLEAESWDRMMQLQGFVQASERLFQMDMIRRSSAGRLSAVFGSKTLELDRKRAFEDWEGAALRSYERLPQEEKRTCDQFALGVNRFIHDYPGQWGLEYKLLGIKPEDWRCTDSLLVMLYMADTLTSSAELELRQSIWRKGLSDDWQNFLFPKSHPWSAPIFGKANRNAAPLPPEWQYLPEETLNVQDSGVITDPVLKGSNAWVVREGDSVLMAADPHLGQSVPQVWYANRLRISGDQWVVGASLPGIPGVVIGMNQNFAWSFTNLGEDVDDYLTETITPDKTQYLAFEQGGRQHWRRLVIKRKIIKIKGEPDDVIEARFTHRGPVLEREVGGTKIFVSRQWTALQPGFLRLPSVTLNQAKNWREFNAALDGMLAPCQAAVYADREGNIGLRITGVSPKRNVTGLMPVEAILGEWQGFEPLSERKRLLIPASSKSPKVSIVNANAQMWEDFYGHRWMADDRRERIVRLLEENPTTVSAMESMQLDTQSRFAKIILTWFMERIRNEKNFTHLVERWEKWDGSSSSDEQSFTEASFLEEELGNLLVDRVQKHFFRNVKELPKYEAFLRRAWLLRILNKRDGLRVFGLNDKETGAYLLNRLIFRLMQSGEHGLVKHSTANTWEAQHPFADNIPYIGWLFRVKSFPQYGATYLVRAERPKFGASVRMVFNLKNLEESTWLFPVGQSGHVGSTSYRNQQDRWITSKDRLKIFEKPETWNL